MHDRNGPAKKRGFRAGVDRRSFLKGSISGGIVLGSASAGFAAGAPDPSGACSNASFIDSLVFERSRLSELESDILRCFVDTLQARSNKCRDDLSAFKDLLDKLNKEICRSGSSTDRRVSEVVELGQASVMLVQTSLTPGGPEPQITASAAINRQILSKAEECLPDGGTTLSPKAVATLKEIIAFMKDRSAGIAAQVQEAQSDHSRNAGAVSAIFRHIGTHINAASRELVIGEIPSSRPADASAALRNAYMELGNALVRLRTLLDVEACRPFVSSKLDSRVFAPAPAKFLDISADDMAKAFSLPVSYLTSGPPAGKIDAGRIETIDLITISLEGIRRGIVKRYNLAVSESDHSRVDFRTASFSQRRPPAAAQTQGVWNLLEKHALSATPRRVADVTAMVQSAYGWVGWWAGDWVQAVLIKNKLRAFPIEPRTGRTPSGYEPSVDRLAAGLAALF